MIGSLYTGVSGLKANTSAMTVIGDNIANVDTTGFKTSKASFANVFSATLGQDRLQIGQGVTMSSVTPSWRVGSLENTDNPTDLSVNGQGMFVAQNSITGADYYTRCGKFEFDKQGYLVTQDGLQVQGFSISPTGVVGSLASIALPVDTCAPQATTDITLGLNLNAGAAVGDTYNTTITTFDSLGNPVDLTFTFTAADLTDPLNPLGPITDPAAATAWTWEVDSSAGVVDPLDTGILTFSEEGDLMLSLSGVPAPGPGAGAAPIINVAGLTGDDLAINWTYLDMTDPLAPITDGSITGYSSQSAKSAQTQNGYPPGELQGVSVDSEGVFSGIYSNGHTTQFSQVALADFGSYTGLKKEGSNLFSASLASGQAVIAAPGTAGCGLITSSSLEMSNVDLANEFVDLITTQRAFQANSKVITTSDEVLSDLINLKR